MHTWTVEGAGRRDGREVIVSVEAITEQEAEAEATSQGILVSSVHRSAVEPDLDQVRQMNDLTDVAAQTRQAEPASASVPILRQIASDVRTIKFWVVFFAVVSVVWWIGQVVVAIMSASKVTVAK